MAIKLNNNIRIESVCNLVKLHSEYSERYYFQMKANELLCYTYLTTSNALTSMYKLQREQSK